MKVLHLFSNSKWTGPAEPALNLCVGLRAAGVEADFACAPHTREAVNRVVETARDRGIEPILRFHLSKHRHPVKNFLDRRALGGFLARGGYDVVHCHLDNDHRIALGPANKHGVPLVRSSYEGLGFQDPKRHAGLLAGTAWLLEPSRRAMAHDADTYGFPPSRMRVVPGSVDTARFDPTRETPDGRRRLGIPPDAFVVGIVARMQRHRRYEDLFDAIRLLIDAVPATRLVVVGRGTHQETVGKSPVRRLGLEEHVVFSGYLEGEDYVGMLRALDVLVFLVPGSDGTCRAVREAMAMGKPVVAADRGMLSEIVDDGKTGYVVDGTSESLLARLDDLRGNRGLRHALGRAGRAKAGRDFSVEAQAKTVADLYLDMRDGRGIDS